MRTQKNNRGAKLFERNDDRFITFKPKTNYREEFMESLDDFYNNELYLGETTHEFINWDDVCGNYKNTGAGIIIGLQDNCTYIDVSENNLPYYITYTMKIQGFVMRESDYKKLTNAQLNAMEMRFGIKIRNPRPMSDVVSSNDYDTEGKIFFDIDADKFYNYCTDRKNDCLYSKEYLNDYVFGYYELDCEYNCDQNTLLINYMLSAMCGGNTAPEEQEMGVGDVWKKESIKTLSDIFDDVFGAINNKIFEVLNIKVK